MIRIIGFLAVLSTGIVEHDDSNGARQCLALTVFAEARGESWLGQAAVAQTVINRAVADGEGVCDVIAAPGQFNGIDDWPFPRLPHEIDAPAWEVAQQVADAVIEGDYVVSPPACASATYFYRSDIRIPGWARGMDVVCKVGNHIFLAPRL